MSPDSSDAQAEIREEIDKLETRWSENPKGRVFAHLADAYRKLGEYSKAENLILHGLKNHPNYISAYIVLGRIYTDSERYSDAHAQFTKVLEIDPQNLIALKFLGDLAIGGGRLEDARSWYERMLQVDPRNEEAQEALAALDDGGPEAIAALQGDAAPAEASPGPEAGVESEAGADEGTEDLGGMPDLQIATPSGDADAAGEPESDFPAPDPAGFEMPGEPLELDATSAEATGEGEAGPWDQGSEVSEEEVGDEAPVDGLMTHDRHERAQTAAERPAEPSDIDEEDTMPWDRILDPEDLGPGEEATSEEEAASEMDLGQAGMAAGPEAGAHDAGSGGSQELNLDDMDDWTPGFLRDEDLSQRQMDDDELFAGLDQGDVSLDLGEGEEDSSEESGGVVTETMAELYAEQGLFEDALRVYRRLLEERPDDERLKAKVREIESKQAQDASISAAEVGADEPAEAGGIPEVAASDAAEPDVSAAAPETDEVAPVSGLVSGSASELVAPNHDGEGEGEFEFEVAAPAEDLANADPFAGSMDAGFLQEPPAASTERPVAEQPASEVATPAPEIEPEAAPAAEEPVDPVDVPDHSVVASAASGPSSPEPGGGEVGDQAVPVMDESGGGERVETTIEDYLSGLLDYDSNAPAQQVAAAKETGSAAPAESDSQEEGESGDSDPEDMAQFQEWLRSLKR